MDQRQWANDLRKQNYDSRKSFYLGLFSGYEKKEFYFSQTSFEKRLIEIFKEKGEEICNNNIDDNENEQVDCDDSQCGGKVCGKGNAVVVNGNITGVAEVDLYCISGICQAKEQKIIVKKGFCGDGFMKDWELLHLKVICVILLMKQLLVLKSYWKNMLRTGVKLHWISWEIEIIPPTRIML